MLKYFFVNNTSFFVGGLCYKYTNRLKIRHNTKQYDPMTKAEGVIYNTESENLRVLRSHLKSKQHQGLVSRLQSMTLEDIMDDDYDFDSGEHESGIYKVTIVSIDIPISSWKDIQK